MTDSIANASGASTSIWMSERVPAYDAALPPALPALDVVIVGAGIAGLSIARTLLARGSSVLILDRGPVGGGQTARTSAHLTSALDDRYYLLRSHFGAEGASIAAASHAAAIDEIERTVTELGIDCDFARVDGYLFAENPRGQRELDKEYAAATEAGLEVAFTACAPLPFQTGRCLRFSRQAQFQPLAYVRSLAEHVTTLGGRIHTGVVVREAAGGDAPHVTLDDGRVITARAIVDATAFGISSRYDIPIRAATYRSYVLGFAIPTGAVPAALFWDTEDPYHYLRVTTDERGGDVLLVGGADHRVGQGDPDDSWAALERWARARFPMAGEIVSRWSGQISEPSDALALIGELPSEPNLFIVTGDSGDGLTHGTIAGQLIPALIADETHPWAALYSPARSKLHGIGTLLHEAIVSNVPFRDWISPADVSSADDIEPGHGATVRHGVHLLAVYKDATGVCHQRSARCPHLHGVVRWNDAEQTWDCPVHGSRFDPEGHVINGPSAHDLPELEVKA